MNVSSSDIKPLLEQYKKICVYGLSPAVEKPSHGVPVYLRNHGYDVIGIYPGGEDFAGFKIYASLADVPKEDRKFLNVFRRAEKIPELVDEILDLGGVEVLWLQLGITHPEAERRAEAAGLKVVSDRCLLIEHRRIFG